MGVRTEGWGAKALHWLSCEQETRRTGQSIQQMVLFQTYIFSIARRKCTLQSMQDWRERERGFIRKAATMPISAVSSSLEANIRGEQRRPLSRSLKVYSTVSVKFMSLWFILYPFPTSSGILRRRKQTNEKCAKIRLT